MPRVRSIVLPPQDRGKFTRVNGNVVNGAQVTVYKQTTSDESPGFGKENPFHTERTRAIITPFNGTELDFSFNPPRPRGSYENFVFSAAARTGAPGGPTTPDSSHVSAVLAGSNPSRPYVDTGTFIGELRDFPGMARSVWNSARNVFRQTDRGKSVRERLDRAFKEGLKETVPKADSRFIEAQFGWIPFVSDVEKYLNVSEVIDKRAKELQKLKATGQGSRRITLDNGRDVDTIYRYAMSTVTGRSYYGNGSMIKAWNRWGVGKWYLDPGGPLALAGSPSEIRKLARKAVMGLTFDSSTAWNLLPWSWLIDWASDAGDWLESNRNIIGASKGSVSIMTYSNCLIQISRDMSIDMQSEVKGGELVYLREIKKRTIHAPSFLPQMTVSALSNRQSAILGALTMMRVRRT